MTHESCLWLAVKVQEPLRAKESFVLSYSPDILFVLCRSKEVRAHDDFDALEKTSQESDKRDGGEPLSFSKIDLSKDPESLEALYPQFPGLKRALRVSLEAGHFPAPVGIYSSAKSF